jgi:hypothetical protein
MNKIEKEIRGLIIFFMFSLFLSGLTAMPLETELESLTRFFPVNTPIGSWLDKVYMALHQTNKDYPFLAYGYDWLAFAHFILAALFIGPLKDPVKNKWVIEFGMLACLLIIPFALVAGQYRGIPIWWRLIDCSFGIIGLVPLFICTRKINELEEINNTINN